MCVSISLPTSISISISILISISMEREGEINLFQGINSHNYLTSGRIETQGRVDAAVGVKKQLASS